MTNFGVGNCLPTTRIISREGQDLSKHTAQTAMVVPIIADPVSHLLLLLPVGRQQETTTAAYGNVPKRISECSMG